MGGMDLGLAPFYLSVSSHCLVAAHSRGCEEVTAADTVQNAGTVSKLCVNYPAHFCQLSWDNEVYNNDIESSRCGTEFASLHCLQEDFK